MTATYEKIATTTLGSAQNTITFTSISGSYTDLIIVTNILGVNTTGYAAGLQFNSDTGSNYSTTNLYGTGSSVASTRASSQTVMYNLSTDLGFNNSVSNAIIQIMNYSNTTTNKTVLTRWNQADRGTMANVGLWRSTSAITSIDIKLFSTYTFNSGSTFTLYGIKAE